MFSPKRSPYDRKSVAGIPRTNAPGSRGRSPICRRHELTGIPRRQAYPASRNYVFGHPRRSIYQDDGSISGIHPTSRLGTVAEHEGNAKSDRSWLFRYQSRRRLGYRTNGITGPPRTIERYRSIRSGKRSNPVCLRPILLSGQEVTTLGHNSPKESPQDSKTVNKPLKKRTPAQSRILRRRQ